MYVGIYVCMNVINIDVYILCINDCYYVCFRHESSYVLVCMYVEDV